MSEFYQVHHYWTGGNVAVYHVECAREPTVEEVVKALSLNFKTDQGEQIRIVPLRMVYIRTEPDAPNQPSPPAVNQISWFPGGGLKP